jgi:hypothetical protein
MRDKPAFNITDELRFGWRQTFAHFPVWLLLGAIIIVFGAAQSALTRSHHSVVGLVMEAIQVAVTLVGVRVALHLADERPLGELNLHRALKGYFSFFVTQFLAGLIFAFGLLLLIVPGIIWGLRYGLAPVHNAAEGTGPIASLRASRRMTRGRLGGLFVFALTCIGINIVGAMVFGIGLFVTLPMTTVAVARVFRRLQRAQS